MKKKSGQNPEMTLAEAAERLGVSKRRVRQIVADGRLTVSRTIQVGALSVHLLSREQVEAFARLDRPHGNYSGKPRTSSKKGKP